MILDKYQNGQPETVSLPENQSETNRTINIRCSTPCVMENEFTIFATTWYQTFVIEIENISFRNSKITIGNVHMVFKNVQFQNSVVTDSKQMVNTFGHVILHFHETQFQNRFVAGKASSLSVTNTFSAVITFTGCSITDTYTEFLVQYLVLKVENTSSSNSHVRCHIDMFCYSQFHNTTFVTSTQNTSNAPLLSLTSLKLSLSFKDCFVRNTGGGIKLMKQEFKLIGSWIQAHFYKCVFHNNTKLGSGGAIEIIFIAPDSTNPGSTNYLKIEECKFWNNKANRIGSESSHGGALNVQGLTSGANCHELNIYIVNSSFLNNHATDSGGAIYISESCTVTMITNNTFVVTDHVFDSAKGIFIRSLSNIDIHMSVFQIEIPGKTPSLMELEMVKSGAKITKLNMTVKCLEWHKLTLTSNFLGHQAKEVIIICTSCSLSFYVPSDGHFSVSFLPNDSTVSVQGTTLNRQTLACMPCPSGAECPGNALTAKPNFWGSNTDFAITMYQCPADYCCSVNCTSYNQCERHRTGVLCGSCQENYSLSMLSQECIEANACRAFWLWPLVVSAATMYMVWYTFKNDVFAILSYITRKLCKVCSKAKDESDIYYIDKGYFGIVTYFVQVKAVMGLSLSLDHTHPINSVFMKIESYLNVGLNFELSYLSNDLCALKDLTTTNKTIFRLLFLFGIFLSWILALLCLHLITQCLMLTRKKLQNVNKFKLKLIDGLVEIVKYTYLGFTSIIFYSLTCVSIAQNNVWLYDGSVQCYIVWQKIMIAFSIIHIIPYPLFIYLGMKLLDNQKITRQAFIVAICFPLPAICLWIFMFCRCSNQERQENIGACGKRDVEQTIYEGFKGGFRESEKGTQYWESVLMLRRLALSATILIPNAMTQLCTCLAMCLVFLFHHTYIRPFRHNISNLAEGLSLTLLCGVAAINLLKAAFLYGEIDHEGPQVEVMRILELIEIMSVVMLILFIVSIEATVAISGWVKEAVLACTGHSDIMTQQLKTETVSVNMGTEPGVESNINKLQNPGHGAEETKL